MSEQNKPELKIFISADEQIQLTIGETVDEIDVIGLLDFNEELLDELLETHAGNQAYWEALAIRLKKRYNSFKEDNIKKWWANNKIYAKLVLNGYGERDPAVSAVKEMTIIVYSKDVSQAMRQKYFRIAYDAYSRKKIPFADDEKTFEDNMYRCIYHTPPWYFESLVETEMKMKEDKDVVEIFAERLYSKSFLMKDYLKLLMAKKYNLGPVSIDERDIMRKTSGKG